MFYERNLARFWRGRASPTPPKNTERGFVAL
jgi:hypothetical protein